MQKEKVLMQSYEDLQTFLADQRIRYQDVTDEVQRLSQERTEALAAHDEAVLNGEDVVALQANIDALDHAINHQQREQALLDASLRGQAGGDKQQNLAKFVLQEAYDLILGPLRHEWDEQAKVVQAAKDAFLAAVGALGEIYIRANSVSARAGQAAEYLPAPKPGTPALATNIYPAHKKGIIYVNPLQCEEYFNKGGNTDGPQRNQD